MHSHLLIHILELGAEAKADRFYISKYSREAEKARKHYRTKTADWYQKNSTSIQTHYKNVVNVHNRGCQLAYAFLIGKKYSEVERSAKQAPDWQFIYTQIMRFYDTSYWPDPAVVRDLALEWILEAMRWYRDHCIRGYLSEWERMVIFNFLRAHNMVQLQSEFYLKKETTNAASQEESA